MASFQKQIEYYRAKLRESKLEKKAMIRVIENQREELKDNFKNAHLLFINWVKEKFKKTFWRYLD